MEAEGVGRAWQEPLWYFVGRSGQGRGRSFGLNGAAGPWQWGWSLLVQYLALGDEARGALPPGV